MEERLDKLSRMQDQLKHRTPEEQYENNLQIWQAFLHPEAKELVNDKKYPLTQDVMKRWLALFDYLGLNFEDLSHGGRVRISCMDIDKLMKAIDPKSLCKFRPTATHTVSVNKDSGRLEEGTLASANEIFDSSSNVTAHGKATAAFEHHGLNLGLCADGKVAPTNGSFGHLYINSKKHNEDTSKSKKLGSIRLGSMLQTKSLGSILVGIEGAESGKKSQFNVEHNANAVKAEFSATGALKWEQGPRNQEFIHIVDVDAAIKYINENYDKPLDTRYKTTMNAENKRLADIRNQRTQACDVFYDGYNINLTHTENVNLAIHISNIRNAGKDIEKLNRIVAVISRELQSMDEKKQKEFLNAQVPHFNNPEKHIKIGTLMTVLKIINAGDDKVLLNDLAYKISQDMQSMNPADALEIMNAEVPRFNKPDEYIKIGSLITILNNETIEMFKSLIKNAGNDGKKLNSIEQKILTMDPIRAKDVLNAEVSRFDKPGEFIKIGSLIAMSKQASKSQEAGLPPVPQRPSTLSGGPSFGASKQSIFNHPQQDTQTQARVSDGLNDLKHKQRK